MERNFISLNGLKKVLSPKEMKNVKGGSSRCCCGMGSDIYCEDGRDIDWVICYCPGSIGGCYM